MQRTKIITDPSRSKMENIVKSIAFSLIVIVALKINGVAVSDPLNICKPCGLYSLDYIGRNRLQMFLKFRVHSALVTTNIAIENAQEKYNVQGQSFDLSECCGETYAVQETDMKYKGVDQLIADAMLNMKDAAHLSDDSGFLTQSVQNLNSSLCALQTIATFPLPATSSNECVKTSQINTCTNGLGGQGKTCRIKMIFRYLFNAQEILTYLNERTSGGHV